MTIIKQVMNEMTIGEVRNALLKYPRFSEFDESDNNYRWVDSEGFKSITLTYANEMAWTINQIISYYLKVNGVEPRGKS